MSLELSNALHAWADLATRQSMESNRQYMHERGYSFAQMNSLFSFIIMTKATLMNWPVIWASVRPRHRK